MTDQRSGKQDLARIALRNARRSGTRRSRLRPPPGVPQPVPLPLVLAEAVNHFGWPLPVKATIRPPLQEPEALPLGFRRPQPPLGDHDHLILAANRRQATRAPREPESLFTPGTSQPAAARSELVRARALARARAANNTPT